MKKIRENTWKHTVKDDPRDRLEIITGDDKQSNFQPQVKLQRWDNEVNASFRLQDRGAGKGLCKRVRKQKRRKGDSKDNIVASGENGEIHYYDLEPSEQLPAGGFEFEVILDSPPESNTLEFSVEDKEVDFYYQPPMTEENLKEEQTTDENNIYDSDGNIAPHRPDHIVGSYAIYTSEDKPNIEGEEKYRSGKVGHIHRPKIVDAKENEVWGSLNYKDGTLIVEIPRDFLDSASYPISIDPTFGYETIGSSDESASGDKIRGIHSTCPESAGLSQITAHFDEIIVYAECQPTLGIDMAVYKRSDRSLVSVSDSRQFSDTNYSQWGDFTISGSLTNQDYWLVLNNRYCWESGPDRADLSYDTVSNAGGYEVYDYGSYPSSFDLTINDKKYSIYATYTILNNPPNAPTNPSPEDGTIIEV